MFSSVPVVGIELELEYPRRPPPELFNSRWNTTTDGSLRYNGREYVSSPVSGADLGLALNELERHVRGTPPVVSHRCSTHCHLDFSDSTVEHVMSFFTGFALFESILYTVSGKDRYSNMYSPGLTSCYSQIKDMRRLGSYVSRGLAAHVSGCIAGWQKYSCLNLSRMPDYGTVEVRSHRGTDDVNDIRLWVRLLQDLWNWTKDRTPQEIVGAASPVLYQEVFKDYEDIPGHEYYDNNLCNAADIAASME